MEINFRADREAHLRTLCEEMGRSVDDFVNEAVLTFMEDYEDGRDAKAAFEEAGPPTLWKKWSDTLAWTVRILQKAEKQLDKLDPPVSAGLSSFCGSASNRDRIRWPRRWPEIGLATGATG